MAASLTPTPRIMANAGTQTNQRYLEDGPIRPIERPEANEAPMNAPIVGGPVHGPATREEAKAARMSAAKVEILADATKALWKTHVSDQRGLRKLTGIVRYFRGLSTAKQENESLKALQQAAKILGKALAKSPERISEAMTLSGYSTRGICPDTGNGEALAAHYAKQDLDEKYAAFCKAYEDRVQDLTSKTKGATVPFSENEYHQQQAFLLACNAAEKAGMGNRATARSVISDLDRLLDHSISVKAQELTAQFVATELGELNPSSFERMASELQHKFPSVYKTHGQAEQALREGIRRRNIPAGDIIDALESPTARSWIDAKVEEFAAQTQALIRTHEEKVSGLEHLLQTLATNERELQRELAEINAARPRALEIPVEELERRVPAESPTPIPPPRMATVHRAQRREAKDQEKIKEVEERLRIVNERRTKVLEELEALRGAPILPTQEVVLRAIAMTDLQDFLYTLVGIEQHVLTPADTRAELHHPRSRVNSGTDSESFPRQAGRLRSTHRQRRRGGRQEADVNPHQAGVPPRNRRKPSSNGNRQPGASGFSTFSIPHGQGRDFAESRRRSPSVASSSSESEMGFGLYD